MKNKMTALLGMAIMFFLNVPTVFAAENTDVAQFTTNSLNVLVLLGSLASTVFLIKGGYTYITSSGNPEALVIAKKTIRNALIGLILIIAASTISSLLNHAFTTPSNTISTNTISLQPIQPAEPQDGITQTMIDAVAGFMQNIIQSATKPLVDGIIQFLTSTPSVLTNSTIFNFWLVILGITDSLFALVIALLGFHFMSASSLGFEEVELKQILGRIFVSFLGANMSIFIVEWIINLSNTLVSAVLKATGGITQAWVFNAFNPEIISVNNTSLITLIFMILFIILSIVLLFMYIARLIIVALGAVLSPFVWLLWTLPQTANYAEIAIKTYIVTIFTVFVHVVTIQLASSFFVVTQQSGSNSLISILVAIGLFFTLLKIPGTLANMAFYTSANQVFRKASGQIMNVISSSNAENVTKSTAEATVIKARKVAM